MGGGWKGGWGWLGGAGWVGRWAGGRVGGRWSG